MKKHIHLYILLFFCLPLISAGQKLGNQEIKDLINSYKKDIRGPYKEIRWFCTDGSIRHPKDPCPDNIGPGVQHATYKSSIIELGNSNHLFLGQILSYTAKEEFWDSENNHSRLKQYQLDLYLRTVDNGWILEKGQYYRGATQAEDEGAWGVDFYKWLLSDTQKLTQNFYLIRQSLKDIPHKGDDNLAQKIRSESKVISDLAPTFMELRVKIHSRPDAGDIKKVTDFKSKNSSNLTNGVKAKIDALISTMVLFYQPMDIAQIQKNTPLVNDSPIGVSIKNFSTNYSGETNAAVLIPAVAELLLDIRQAIPKEVNAEARLQVLDASLKLEEIIFKNAPQWQPEDLNGLLDKVCYLGMATAGAGYIELAEWEQLNLSLKGSDSNSLSLGQLTTVLENARREVEWSSSMVKANYQEIVEIYTAFEPKAYGFIDDKIRGSIALRLGETVGELGDIIARESTLTNRVMDLENQSGIRGLNPGYALGELLVVDGSPDDIEVSSDKIYIFQRPPSDLKPVAGIATVSEGNMVSHVQLLARNMGIPNAALGDENLKSLQKYNGDKVFYAVSNKGNVIMKLEKDMSQEERNLFIKTERKEERIEVPIQNIRLDENAILNLRSVDADDSGKLCGPKAANLGQLKKMFPDMVVEGLVIPFGIFRDHMDQPMPDQQGSYWEFLNATFMSAETMRNQGIAEGQVENYQLRQLEILRGAIKKMPMKSAFIAQLENGFQDVLGKAIGEIPVFLRSDTNMEDLKNFTGAGLNLTIFNVADKEKIISGIKDVWASPYSERSFKWRQKYLLNPQNVFPSILIIPSVDVDYSGVLITKGISSGNPDDLTIAFSRGAGGAVDGQSAETYLVRDNGGTQLLAPAREMYHNRLPVVGGTEKRMSTFENFILNQKNIDEIRTLAKTIRETMPTETKSDYEGAYDVELGFQNNRLWLFQIRPFVENKKALSSQYLESITPKIDLDKSIPLSKKI
ncbi:MULTISPECIES: PEP/pyruvate-binding domain-containing protein [unclassified Arenibacter]|uniref:PEP/pyruvate-binding domain-containing protein n=1 Tax=unclassified Arenibacter TaxID=2615047 RepID=UPI000E347067|nr:MULTISPECIES: PEP/pyruvate-binding domain-containing protein [unclassified Arenibacter]MCM4165306.1 phosphoenolpyruvate synthase [Arenibacter sp. A80]RFT55156.1 phosphoenolpyruvate synthase [Arenibacter sp. P308M17]